MNKDNDLREVWATLAYAAMQRPKPPAGLVFVGFLLFLLAACVPKSVPPVVKIGLIAPFEGPSRSLGYSVLHAVELRLSQWNASGNSPKVELVALNDDGNPELAAKLPAQLAADPDIMLVLGPAQGHTARATLAYFAALDLPVLALAPLPDAHPSAVYPFAGVDSELLAALDPFVEAEGVAWEQPLVGRVIWVGDPGALAELVQAARGDVAGAGAVAAEDAFAAWAGPAAVGLTWASAWPDNVPSDFAQAYEARAGVPPSPSARLAYAAAGSALSLLNEAASRAEISARTGEIIRPPLHVYRRTAESCCQLLQTP